MRTFLKSRNVLWLLLFILAIESVAAIALQDLRFELVYDASEFVAAGIAVQSLAAVAVVWAAATDERDVELSAARSMRGLRFVVIVVGSLVTGALAVAATTDVSTAFGPWSALRALLAFIGIGLLVGALVGRLLSVLGPAITVGISILIDPASVPGAGFWAVLRIESVGWQGWLAALVLWVSGTLVASTVGVDERWGVRD